MYRSHFTEDKEDRRDWNLVFDPDHIGKVWSVINRNFSKHWTVFKESLKEEHKTKSASTAFTKAINTAIEQYENDRQPYLKLFQQEGFKDFYDDPTAIRPVLKSEIPLFRNALFSEREEMKEFQRKFWAKPPMEIMQALDKVVDFGNNYTKSCNIKEYIKINDFNGFGFKPLEEEPEYTAAGVIGMGIKSAILYYSHPHLFPRRSRQAVYALYFLSGKAPHGMPSKSSEFLMIDDLHFIKGSNRMDNNFWYPYEVFSLYTIRINRFIENTCRQVGALCNTDYRYVFVDAFFGVICQREEEAINRMVCGDLRKSYNGE